MRYRLYMCVHVYHLCMHGNACRMHYASQSIALQLKCSHVDFPVTGNDNPGDEIWSALSSGQHYGPSYNQLL